jgi:hypothetical protein
MSSSNWSKLQAEAAILQMQIKETAETVAKVNEILEQGINYNN